MLEHMNELNASIQKWLEKNSEFIEFVVPVEDSLTNDPVQAMFCGPIERMHRALKILAASGLNDEITVLRTEYLARDLSMIDVLEPRTVPKATRSSDGPIFAGFHGNRSWPSVTITMM